jgi:16S rRNA (uracil1498-N3)-methyltransferase
MLLYDLFFLNNDDTISNNELILINRSEIQHISKSLRKSIGDCICVSDGHTYYYDVEISDISQKALRGVILKSYKIEIPKQEIWLYPSTLKGATFDLLIEKAVELGVHGIQPILTDNTIAKKDKVEKWHHGIIKALKQSKQPRMVPILDAVDLMKCSLSGLLIVPEIHTSVLNILQLDLSKANKLCIFVGPEGGFSQREIQFFKERDAQFVTLGNQRLRAETAAWKSIVLVQENSGKSL